MKTVSVKGSFRSCLTHFLSLNCSLNYFFQNVTETKKMVSISGKLWKHVRAECVVVIPLQKVTIAKTTPIEPNRVNRSS